MVAQIYIGCCVSYPRVDYCGFGMAVIKNTELGSLHLSEIEVSDPYPVLLNLTAQL